MLRPREERVPFGKFNLLDAGDRKNGQNLNKLLQSRYKQAHATVNNLLEMPIFWTP